uniref:Uncharacterized protein n=1 Tax=Arundo donax TaxID=35708 RepID=A0A0A9BW51_ARUDO
MEHSGLASSLSHHQEQGGLYDVIRRR